MAVISEIRAASNFNVSMSSDMGTTSLLWEALFAQKSPSGRFLTYDALIEIRIYVR